MTKIKYSLFPELKSTIELVRNTPVAKERKKNLQTLIDYIQRKVDNQKGMKLNFICTHNSRRSQFAQVWAQATADLFQIKTSCFSGGVEVTAFNERAIKSLKGTGFKIEKEGTRNPKYFISYAEKQEPIIAFSKMYDDPVNPVSNFAAIMTCSHADKNCPFIPGAEIRVPVQYEDPKEFDGTPLETAKYDSCSLKIASEMYYVFSQIKNN